MKNALVRCFFLLVTGFALTFCTNPNATAAEKVYHWKLQVVDSPALLEYKAIAERFADRVRELSKGRLDIKVFPPGGLVPSFEVWDALRRGMLQMTIHYAVYWSGKVPELKFANEWPVHLTQFQTPIWFYNYDGLELTRKVYAKHGLYYLDPVPLYWEHIMSKKPLKGVEDLKGLKMRAAGLSADAFAALGASIVVLPGGEIYQALEKGVIDACEFTTPTANYALGLHEVAKYIILPTYSSNDNQDAIINMKAWEELPDDLKAIVEVAMKETNYLYFVRIQLETQRVMQKYKEEGVQFLTWSNEDMQKVYDARLKVTKKYAEKSPMCKEIFESRLRLLKELGYEGQE